MRKPPKLRSEPTLLPVQTPVKVSVVVPAYNAAGTLAEAIESVLAQDYPEWELVVVDDGSTDATAEIARGFAERDSRIRVISQPNGGESAARNTGIDRAQHDWLLFLDADDWIAPAHLALLTAELASHPEFDAVHCGSVRVAMDGSRVSDDYQPPTGDLFPILARRAAFPVHACIVRKSLVEAVGKLDTSLRTCPDWDLWQRIARTGARFGAIREVLAFYRMTSNSSSLRAEQLFRDGLTVLKRGHSHDPRVAKPDPAYVKGLTTDKVESQVFYLLCWSAGLLLGAGEDARALLETVREYHYSQLYPNAIAQCIFESGTLAASRSRYAWEGLFPEIAARIEQFLSALEEQSQTPDLAALVLPHLKKMILRQSRNWRSVIEQQDRDFEQLQTEKSALERWAGQLQAEKSTLENDLGEQTRAAERLRAEKSTLENDLKDLRQQQAVLAIELAGADEEARRLNNIVEDRERVLTRMRGRGWVRLGSRLGLLKESDLRSAVGVTDSTPALPGEIIAYDWQFRVGPDSLAELCMAPGRPGVVEVHISKSASSAKWDIQLNHAGLKLDSGCRYALYFRARADGRRRIGLGLAKACEPWTNLGFYRDFGLTREWQSFHAEFAVAADEDNARVHLDLGGSETSVEVSPVHLFRIADPAVESGLSAAGTGPSGAAIFGEDSGDGTPEKNEQGHPVL